MCRIGGCFDQVSLAEQLVGQPVFENIADVLHCLVSNFSRGQNFHITPKSMAVFECLASANGASVSRNDLFDTVWPRADVSDDTLTQCIVELRKAFGDSAKNSRVIETIPKMGFRLIPAS